MRSLILALAIFLTPLACSQAWAQTQLSIGIADRGVSLGFVISTYPTLARVPGYPVYYAPRLDLNYFFYDGLYWVYLDDTWYSSTWYDGPWYMVSPVYVPLFILRIPVRYYRRPPPYFRSWRADAAPRWGEHWGREWERERHGWDRWDRRSVPGPAPLPTYQRNYSGNLYPRQLDRQRSIESDSYRYRSREAVSRQIRDERRQGEEPRDRQQPGERQQQERGREQQEIQQRQSVERQQQQQQRTRQPQGVPSSQQRTGPQPQQRSQPAPRDRGSDGKGGKGRSDKNKDRKDGDRDGAGQP